MLSKIRNYFAPPVFEGDEEKTNTAALLSVFLLVVLVGTIFYPIASVEFLEDS